MPNVREKSLYELYAEVLEYPREDIKIKTEECYKALLQNPKYLPEAADELKRFLTDLEGTPLDDIQGVYSYTFELASEFTMDLGAHLFDGFKRSNHLAALKSMYRENGFPIDEVAKGELPDRLPIILKFLGFTDNEELKKDLKESFVVIAMEKLNKNFDKITGNIYRHLINSVYRVIDRDVKEAK